MVTPMLSAPSMASFAISTARWSRTTSSSSSPILPPSAASNSLTARAVSRVSAASTATSAPVAVPSSGSTDGTESSVLGSKPLGSKAVSTTKHSSSFTSTKESEFGDRTRQTAESSSPSIECDTEIPPRPSVLATNRVRTQFQDNSDLWIRHALHFSQDPGSTLTQWQAIEFGFQGVEKCCAADFFARITQTGISFFPEFVHIGGAGADFSIEIRDLARTDREQPGLGARAPLKPRKLAPRSDAGFLDDVVDVTLAREQSTGKSIQVRAVSADDDVE